MQTQKRQKKLQIRPATERFFFLGPRGGWPEPPLAPALAVRGAPVWPAPLRLVLPPDARAAPLRARPDETCCPDECAGAACWADECPAACCAPALPLVLILRTGRGSRGSLVAIKTASLAFETAQGAPLPPLWQPGAPELPIPLCPHGPETAGAGLEIAN